MRPGKSAAYASDSCIRFQFPIQPHRRYDLQKLLENKLAADAGPIGLVLDLAGDRRAAVAWAEKHLQGVAIRTLDKADLKWASKLEALRRVRKIRPRVLAFYTSDLRIQSARSPMMLFAAAAGAQRILFGDRRGEFVEHSAWSALAVHTPRLLGEMVVGYLLIVPLSWLFSALLLLASPRSERRSARAPGRGKFKALFLRATLVPGTDTDSIGGLATHAAGFIAGATALGHKLDFLVTSASGLAGANANPATLPPSSALSATRALLELTNNLLFTGRSISYMQQRGILDLDFIYQRYSRFNWTGAVLSMMTGLPLLLEFNGSEVWIARHWDPVGLIGLLKLFERVDLRAAALILVVSEAQQRELLAAGIHADRIVVNPNGVDTELFRPRGAAKETQKSLGIADRIVVGFGGTFGPWHGASVLAAAAKLLRDGSRFHFLFVGDGDQLSLTEAAFDSPANGARATFAGRVAPIDVPRYLDACDILVSPQVPSPDGSEFFGSPTKLFEYMAMAKPIIASRLGQMAQVIDDGKNGILVEPGNPAEIAQAIELLAGDESLRHRLGSEARHCVTENYTWTHNAERVFTAASRLISSGGGIS